MKKKAVRFMPVALSIALMLGLTSVGSAVDDYPGSSYVVSLVNHAGNDEIEVGDTITVDIVMGNVGDGKPYKMYAGQAEIKYDSAAVEFVSAEDIATGFMQGHRDSKVLFGCVSFDMRGFDRPAEMKIATVTFKALKESASKLEVVNVEVANKDATKRPIEEMGELAIIIGNGGVEPPTPDPGDTVTVTTEDELLAAVNGVIDTGKSLEIRVEGTIPVDELYIQGCSITLTGGGTLERKSTESALITVLTVDDKSGSLTLKDITLGGSELPAQGSNAVNTPIVLVHDAGALVIEDGAVLESNHCGSAVLAEGGATVTMTGGTIRNNIALQGAGLHIDAATAVMSGGTISGNTAAPSGMGGGVFAGGTNGSFRMEGGVISGNTALKELVEGQGGGVFVDTNATFTMTSGEIKDNVSQDGALTGIGVYNLGTFMMSGGTISGNVPGETPAGARAIVGMGGGVYTQGNFAMSGGSITGNTGTFSGGVIYDGACLGGSFTLSGEANISGNTDAILSERADISLNRGHIQVVGALRAAGTMTVYPYDHNSSGRGIIAQGTEGYLLTQADADKFLPFAGGWSYGFEYANDTLQFVMEQSGAVLPSPYASAPAGAYKDAIPDIELHTDTEAAEIYYQVVNEWPSGPINQAAFCTEEKKYTGGGTIEISNESPYSILMLCAKKGAEYSNVGVNQYAFPRIVDMWVSPAGVTVLKGKRATFTGGAICEGGRVRTELSWSVEGATSGDTAIDQFGVLTVGADEAATTLTVKLTDSVFGAIGTATARIKVNTFVVATQSDGVYGQPLPELTKSVEHEGTNGEWWILYSGTEGTEYETSEVKPTAAGDYIVIADYSSDEYKGYAVAPFVIEKAPLTAKPTDKSIYVGAALPTEFSLAYTGLVNGDTASVLTVTGTPEYALKNGDNVLENSNTAGTYAIQWSNKDAVTIEAANYIVTEGDGVLTISTQSSGGGSAPVPPKPPKPTENPDGSATTTEIDKKTGTVRATTKYPDGKTEIVETKKDGTITAKVETADGTKTEQIKKPDGSMSAKEERKDGTKLESKTTSDGTTTASVSVPDHVEKVTVTVPTPAKPKAGEVAVIVKEDGTREVIKTSVCTEEGMRVTLPAGATLEIADNTKQFADVSEGNWAAEAVQFATSRELFSGTGADRFSPSENMSRAMLFTVLARLDGQDTAGGANWYDEATNWAKTEGLSDGTASERDITREQMVVMLYRYVGSPDAEAAALDGFSDAGAVSPWAKNAMRWATESGLVGGKSGNTIAPTAIASRAEVAAILQRFVSGM